jgi:integrase
LEWLKLTEKKIRPYENDPYIKRWLTGLSPKTKENYPNFFQDFLTFVKLSPTEIISKRMNDLTSKDITERCFFEDKFRAFKEMMESTGTNSDSKVHDRLKVASSFFTRNGLPLALKKGDWNSTQKQNVTEKKTKLNLDDVKRLYGHANLRDKCLLLILAQSGFSEADISELKIEDIKDLYSMPVNEHYPIEKKREKTNHVQQTCLSYEFLHDLRALLSEKGNPKEGYIFTSQTKEKGTANIDSRRINEIIKALFEKTFGAEKAKEYQTRSLRSFYNSALLRAKIQPQELKNRMMGHDIGVQGHYACDDETIKEAYIAAFEYLSINGIQSREDLKAMKDDLNRLIGSQQVEIEQRKAERKADLERIGKLEDFIRANTQTDPNTIKKIVSTLETISSELKAVRKDQREQSLDILQLQDKAKIKSKPLKDTGV